MTKGKAAAIPHFTPGKTDPLSLPPTFSFDLEAPPGLTLASTLATLNAQLGSKITAGGLPCQLLAAEQAGDVIKVTVKAWPDG